jgi:hypothetical protein
MEVDAVKPKTSIAAPSTRRANEAVFDMACGGSAGPAAIPYLHGECQKAALSQEASL